jgi:hypothetical protein
VKAGRPDRMPPHWMRDVMVDTQTLKSHIKQGDMKGAMAFLDTPELAGHKRYMPEFRALQHFVRFNMDSEYREEFSNNCIVVFPITNKPDPKTGVDPNPGILEGLVGVADWSEKNDTIVAANNLDAYPIKADKRIRSGQLPSNKIPNDLLPWQKLVQDACIYYWRHQMKKGTMKTLFGVNNEKATNVNYALSYHLNEILSGPVLGPHYHTGNQGNAQAVFPLISAVFYPKTIPENPKTKSGYLEIGRPNFPTSFEPFTQTVRPIAGHLVVFPAFAFHGVVPIEESPRYSVNIDCYVRPASATTFSVTNFFE